MAEPVSYIPQGYELWALAYPAELTLVASGYSFAWRGYSPRKELAECGIHLGRVVGWTVFSDGGLQPLCPEFAGVQGKKSLKYSEKLADLRDQAELLLKSVSDATE